MMTKSLDARVIIEILDEGAQEQNQKNQLSGLEDENKPVKVKIHSWGTLPDGSDYPLVEGLIGYCQASANMTKIGDNRYLMARGFVMGLE